MRSIVVKSSLELTDSQKKKLESGIKAKEKEELEFEYQVDKRIGGIVVMDGERLVDASFTADIHKIGKEYDKIVAGAAGKIDMKKLPDMLSSKLKNISTDIKAVNCGKVISAADGIVSIDGLSACKFGELLTIGAKGYALAMNLEHQRVGAMLLSGGEEVEYGDIVNTTGKILEVPVGEKLLGRVISPLGEPMDGKPRINAEITRRIESDAPGIIDRSKVNKPLSTGILAIDAMAPIGKGQRELIIGDRQTGKTSICIDAILNQKGKNVYCVYVAIGQRASAIGKIVRTLENYGAMEYTTVVLSTAADSAPLQYIAPYTGTAIAEHFMYEGKDALIIYDDLSKHAVAYRTVSLLLRRPAGREAYPGDVFYIHSRLLERSAKMSAEKGGGSLTALPIVETQAGDISAYIPTNIISITDGQIYLERELFNAGFRPAVNVGLSVSRVGGSAQTAAVRKLSSQLRLEIAHYRELAIFSQFGASLDKSTKEILDSGAKTVESLKQEEGKPLSPLKEEIYLFAIVGGYLKKIPLKKVCGFLEDYYTHAASYLASKHPGIGGLNEFSQDEEKAFGEMTEQFASLYAGEEED